MALGEPQPSWSATTDNSLYFNPPTYTDFGITSTPADITWNHILYRNEGKLNELTKTMGSIIALTEWLEDKPKEPMTDEQKKALLEHLNNLLLLTTKDFMAESQKPKHPSSITITATAQSHQIIGLSNPTGGISVQTQAQAEQIEDRKEE